MRYFREISVEGLVAVVIGLVVILMLCVNRGEVIKNRTVTQDSGAQLREEVREWKGRTVNRWNELARRNPGLDVPAVEEPDAIASPAPSPF